MSSSGSRIQVVRDLIAKRRGSGAAKAASFVAPTRGSGADSRTEQGEALVVTSRPAVAAPIPFEPARWPDVPAIARIQRGAVESRKPRHGAEFRVIEGMATTRRRTAGHDAHVPRGASGLRVCAAPLERVAG